MRPDEYEALLSANERELWALTEDHGKLVNLVESTLWPRAEMTMDAKMRDDVAGRLSDLGCEVGR